jgi:YHS domain-containing protein
MQRDPVCQMEIHERDAVGKAKHQDRTYYFCSTDCKRKFEENPTKYVALVRAGGGSAG